VVVVDKVPQPAVLVLEVPGVVAANEYVASS
jgi:hypothetical protein